MHTRHHAQTNAHLPKRMHLSKQRFTSTVHIHIDIGRQLRIHIHIIVHMYNENPMTTSTCTSACMYAARTLRHTHQ